MEGEQDQQAVYDRSFLEDPAILDKHRGAAVVVDGKSNI